MFGKLTYPPTAQSDVVDDFFGTVVPDPYRWLENADDPDVVAWTQMQQDFSDELLQRLPARETFRNHLNMVWDYPKYGLIEKRRHRLFLQRMMVCKLNLFYTSKMAILRPVFCLILTN